MPELLSDKVADRLTVIALLQQVSHLLQQLPGLLGVLRRRQSRLQNLRGGGELAGEQIGITAHPQGITQPGPDFGGFRSALAGYLINQFFQYGALRRCQRRIAGCRGVAGGQRCGFQRGHIRF
ncbi:hypothetical protein [Musicola paradisiaca]|uniref:hypothetical protein n=1 Tax=Musicola paradisiaca TaxID=69223 RepID=UPI0005598536|nr:hypothetical protein [Musicola paradisiaca]